MRSDYIQWDHMFLEMCGTVAKRSKDNSTQCGAVLVDNRHVVIATGFNGPPPELDDERIPWNTRPQKYAYIIHAEENAILFGMEARGSIRGSTLYCSHHPCAECTLRIIRAGVKEVVIPRCHAAYPLSKFQVNPDEVLDRQLYPKLVIREV